jgi:hypothetical protein
MKNQGKLKITLNNLSDFAMLSLSDEMHIQSLLGCEQDQDVLQAMVNYLIELPIDWEYGGCEFCD